MTARPNDWGDRHPSDLDDTPPKNPTEGFQERDYSIDSLDPTRRKAEGEDQVAFDPPHLNEPPIIRNCRFALILKEADPPVDPTIPFRQYYILLQTGEATWGYIVQQLPYELLAGGDDVAVIRDQKDNWIIVGRTHPKELPVLDVVNSAGQQGTSIVVPYDTIITKTPIDDTFGGFDEVFLKTKGHVTLNGEEEALYEFQFSVVLEQIFPVGQGDLDTIFVEGGCWKSSNFPTTQASVKTAKLFFNRQVGFEVQTDSVSCTVGVTLKSSVTDSVLNQQSTRADPFWTDTPKFGGNLQIGTQRSLAWLKIGSEVQAWITHGGRPLKLRLPPGAPRVNPSFLMGEATGTCVRTFWQRHGGSGTICVKGCEIESYSYCYSYCCDEEGYSTGQYSGYCYSPNFASNSYVVENGLLISGPGLSSFWQSTRAFCPDTPRKNHDPCGFNPQ